MARLVASVAAIVLLSCGAPQASAHVEAISPAIRKVLLRTAVGTVSGGRPTVHPWDIVAVKTTLGRAVPGDVSARASRVVYVVAMRGRFKIVGSVDPGDLAELRDWPVATIVVATRPSVEIVAQKREPKYPDLRKLGAPQRL